MPIVPQHNVAGFDVCVAALLAQRPMQSRISHLGEQYRFRAGSEEPG